MTEWFDGNDYNPTDESVGVIDNETYDIASETGVDGDNDWGNALYRDDGDYGYDYDDPYGDNARTTFRTMRSIVSETHAKASAKLKTKLHKMRSRRRSAVR